jgi:hypothetical protein
LAGAGRIGFRPVHPVQACKPEYKSLDDFLSITDAEFYPSIHAASSGDVADLRL